MGTTLHKDLTGADLHVNALHADTHVVAGTDPLVLAESQVTDLTTDLSGKVETDDARLSDARAPTAHTQAESTITNLVADLAGKAPTSHSHSESDVVSLVSDLAGKAPVVHTHVKADITDFPAIGAGTVTAVTGTSPVVSSEGATPAISLPAATNSAPGHATAAQISALEAATAAQHAIATIGTGNGLSIEGQAISLAPATASVPGAATAAQITKLDGIAAGATANVGTVTGVTATAPVTSSGGAAPVIALPAATASVDGYATKEQITKLDGIATGAKVGDVVGPAAAIAGNLATFADTTGKVVQDGGENKDASLQAQLNGVRPFAAPVVTATYDVPGAIDATGATDVNAALTAFIATVPDGSIIDFPTGATYLLDYSGILVLDKSNLIFNGNGATLVVGSHCAGDNLFATPFIIGAHSGDPAVYHTNTDIVVHDFIIVGNSPTPGVYIDGQEYEANLAVEYSDRVEVYNVTGSAAYGDFLYIKDANGVWVHDCHSPTLGRNGVSVISGSDILIERNAFDVSGWSTFDFEPNEATESVSNITARNNTAGTWSYGLLALGSDAGGIYDNIVLDNNVVTGGSIRAHIGNNVSTERMTRIAFTNNKGTIADGPVLTLRYVDGLTVFGNDQPLSSGDLMSFTDCTGVTAQLAAPGGDASALSFVKEFSVPFPTGTANQKFDIYWTGSQTFDGLISVEVTDEYADANASGYLRKIFGIYTEDATIYTNVSKVTDVIGPIAAQDAISEFSWDATNSRYKITIVHRTSMANKPTVRVSFFAQNATILSAVSTVAVTAVYTTDATVYGALVETAAPLNAPTFTGVPSAPTAAVDTNTTQLATTAMVLAQAASATPLIDATTAVVGVSTRFARGDHVHPTDTGRAAASAITNVDNTSDATKDAAAVTLTNHRFTRRVDTQTTTNDITPEISTYDIFIRSAQAHALVINNHSTSTPVDGDMMLFEILSDASVRAITYGNLYVAKAGVALPAATVASKNLTLLFIWRADLTQWVLLSAGQEA